MNAINSKLINTIIDNGVNYVHNRGYHWYKQHITPIITSNSLHQLDPILIADFWYVIGDVHHFNNAPIKAIECYQKAITLDPEFAAAYREIASMQYQLGDYQNALINIKKALLLDADDQYSQLELESIQIALTANNIDTTTDTTAFFNGISNLLANEQFEKAQLQLESKNNDNTIHYLQVLARTLGALNKDDEYVATWRQIIHLNQPIEIEYADWYYMPDSIYEGIAIWEIFKDLNSHITSSIFVAHDSLIANYPNLSPVERRLLVCNYNIYTNSNSITELNNLKEQYPLWLELHNT